MSLTGSVFALAALLVASSPAKAQDKDEKQAQAEKILDKSIEVRGGREAFENLYNRVSKGDARTEAAGQAAEGTVAIYSAAPGQMYFVLDLGPAGKIETGSDGFAHWDLAAGTKASLRTGEAAARASRDRRFNSFLYWRDHYERVEVVGKEVVDGHPCYKVVLTPAVGRPETLYFSRKTGFPIRRDSVITSEAGDIQLVDRMEDYRQIDGVFMPFKNIRTVISPSGPERTYTWTWKTIEHNVDIPFDRFELPEEVQKLVDKDTKKEEKKDRKKSGKRSRERRRRD